MLFEEVFRYARLGVYVGQESQTDLYAIKKNINGKPAVALKRNGTEYFVADWPLDCQLIKQTDWFVDKNDLIQNVSVAPPATVVPSDKCSVCGK